MGCGGSKGSTAAGAVTDKSSGSNTQGKDATKDSVSASAANGKVKSTESKVAATVSPKEEKEKPAASEKQVNESDPTSAIPGEVVELSKLPDQVEQPTDTLEKNLGVLLAVSRLQRTARRKKALKVAHAEQQWKMFADLDTQDEAEMLHLAVFMQTLIDSVNDPNEEKEDKAKDAFSMTEDEHEEDAGVIKLESIDLKDGHRNSFTGESEYDVGTGKIDSKAAAEIIEVYRHGGKVSRKTVVKILRRAYKILQKQPNVTHIQIPAGTRLNVVGDLHGQLSDLLHIIDESGLPDKTNRFIFNGDFVDRGEKGLEIVVILFALLVAEGPEVVCLNRGNHEDPPSAACTASKAK